MTKLLDFFYLAGYSSGLRRRYTLQLFQCQRSVCVFGEGWGVGGGGGGGGGEGMEVVLPGEQ